MLSKTEHEFDFAGFSWPKFVWTLPKGPFKKRYEDLKHPFTGGCYHAPKPLQAGDNGKSFYLDDYGMPGLRWEWCDEITRSIRHTGWYFNDYGEKIRGIVMTLPNNRGWIAGWSMGEGMASSVDYDIFDDRREAALCANDMAETAAKEQREHEEQWEREQGQEEELEEYKG